MSTVLLPGLGGYEVSRRLKANPSLRHVPVIAVTSDAMSGSDAKALATSRHAYFAKPCDPMALLANIRESVARDRP